jgi:hypothetical protein
MFSRFFLLRFFFHPAAAVLSYVQGWWERLSLLAIDSGLPGQLDQNVGP